MALRIPSREFTSSGRGAGTREERSWAAGCCLAASIFEAFTVSVFGAEDDDCAPETGAKTASARNASSSKEFTVSSVLRGTSLSLARSARAGVYLRFARRNMAATGFSTRRWDELRFRIPEPEGSGWLARGREWFRRGSRYIP